MVEALGKMQPGLKNLLWLKGLGDSAMVASLLIRQAERYQYIRGAKRAAAVSTTECTSLFQCSLRAQSVDFLQPSGLYEALIST